jgi:hypothetical protein
LEKNNKEWRLTVYTTLHTLHQSLLKDFSDDDLINENEQGDEEYNKSAAFEYLEQHIRLTANGKILAFSPLTASISNHQSQFVFKVSNTENISDEIHAEISAMSDNLGQHNLFKIHVETQKNRVMLSERNSFKGVVSIPL